MVLNFPDGPSNNATYLYTTEIKDPSDPSKVIYFRSVNYTYKSSKDTWTGKLSQSGSVANVQPLQITADPPFLNAGEAEAGTEANPYQLTPTTCRASGTSVDAVNVLTVTGQTPSSFLYFQNMGTTDNRRFGQFINAIDNNGEAIHTFRYDDTPATDEDLIVTYTALIRLGDTWITWLVTQGNTSVPAEYGTPTPDPTPSPTPDPTPSPTPDPTPSPTPDPTPSPTPDPTPSPTPDPTPSPTPDPSPSPYGGGGY